MDGLTAERESPQNNYHYLRLHFPAMELLPRGQRPFVNLPKDIGYREEPQLGSYHLDASNLDYFTRFQTEESAHVPSTPAVDIFSAHVTRLSEAPGLSDLHAVSYIGEHDIATNIRLVTTWFLSSGKVRETAKEFEVLTAEWQTCVSLAGADPNYAWVKLLNDLMMASSDRAYLHNRQIFEAYDEAWIDRVEGR